MTKTTIGFDWITLTLVPAVEDMPEESEKWIKEDWSDEAEEMLDQIEAELNLSTLKIEGRNTIARLGYTKYRNYADIIIGYHDLHRYMGICIQFSGKALSQYRQFMNGSELIECELFRIWHNYAGNVGWRARCTRLDIAIDEFNGTRKVGDFINEYGPKHDDRQIFQTVERTEGKPISMKSKMTVQVIEDDDSESFYLGSMSSDCRLNIYNKMKERQRKNIKLDADIESWVRYEGRFKTEYALTIFNECLGFTDVAEFLKYLYAVMISKFEFRKKNGITLHSVSQDWLARSKGTKALLKSEDRRDSDFQSMYEHIVKRSGLMSLLRKSELIFGADAVDALIEALRDEYNSYQTTNEIQTFAELHRNDTMNDLPMMWQSRFPQRDS